MGNITVPQSIPICGVLAGGGGVFEVFATAVLAYPAARAKEGFPWPKWKLKVCLGANVLLQIIASLLGNLFATWYGPVSIVGPVFFAAQLVANLLIFWIALGLESFTKDMNIGTIIIVVATAILLVTGPDTQDDQDFNELITKPYAMAWSIFLILAMVWTSIYLFCIDLAKKESQVFKIIVLLISRSSAFALNLSAGRALILEANRMWIIITIILKILSGAIYTKAIVVQSTAVKQSTFVPINAASILSWNAATGFIIWEDWKVVQSWTGYACVFLLLFLGCALLLGDLQLLSETTPETFRTRYALLRAQGRRNLIDNIQAMGESVVQVPMAAAAAAGSVISGRFASSHEDEEQESNGFARRRPPSPSRRGNFFRSESHRTAWGSLYGVPLNGQSRHRLPMLGGNNNVHSSNGDEEAPPLATSGHLSQIKEDMDDACDGVSEQQKVPETETVATDIEEAAVGKEGND